MRFYLRVLSYFRRDLTVILGLLVLIWAALGLGVLDPLPLKVMTDAVLPPRPAVDRDAGMFLRFLPGDTAGRVVGLALIWLVLRVTQEVVTLLREMINNRLKFAGTGRVRAELFAKFQSLGADYHKARPQGDAIYRLSTDALGFFGVINTFIGAGNSVLTVVVLGGVMLLQNKTITVVVLCLAPFLVWANMFFGRTIWRTSTESKRVDAGLTTFTQRSLATVGVSQLFNRQGHETHRFAATVDDSVRAAMRMSWQEQLYPLAQRCLYAVGYGFVLGYGGYLVYRDQVNGKPNGFRIGDVLQMTVYLGQLWEPLRRLAGFTADVKSNVASCERVFAVLDLPPSVADARDAVALPVQPRTLALEEVGFRYPQGATVLVGASARIEPGQMVAFVGASGTGKSTVLNLLPRLYDPANGRITLDGNDLRRVRVADVRSHIAVVPQESPVLAGTVAENIAYGRPDATADEIARAAELAGAAEFIEAMPQRYDTFIAEGGQNLSGGQRQRLAIARALLTEAPILVLDEPTSALDPHHQRVVMDVLRRLKGRRTVVLVTHDLPSVKECDQIFVLGGGRVAEQGTHEELMRRRGQYYEMSREAGEAGEVGEPAAKELELTIAPTDPASLRAAARPSRAGSA